MAKIKSKIYTVSGEGPFPFDMLRYDQGQILHLEVESWEQAQMRRPVRERFRNPSPLRSVKVRAQQCTVARWQSFGWTVE